MSEEHDAEPKQKTPTGVEIPVPTRDAVLRDLKKVAQPIEHEPAQGAQSSADDNAEDARSQKRRP
jgi:hypothetical protein